MIAGPPSRGPTVPEALVGVAPAEAESGATSGNTAATAAAQQLARKSRHSQERRRGAGRCARCVMQTAHCITSCTTSTSCTASSRSAGTKTGLSVVSSTDSVVLQQKGDGALQWHENGGTDAHLGHPRSGLAELSDSRPPVSRIKTALQLVGQGRFLVVFVIADRPLRPHRGLRGPLSHLRTLSVRTLSVLLFVQKRRFQRNPLFFDK